MIAGGKDLSEDAAIPAGALNLLRDCEGCGPGERLLIVEEPDGAGYYDDETPNMAARAARELGLRVYRTQAPAAIDDAAEMAAFVETLQGFDHVIFFARVGDQLRFSDLRDLPSATMCYTLDRDMLDSEFGAACHHGMCELKSAIDDAFAAATEVRVTCANGTDYVGRPHLGAEPVEVSLKRFPMLVPRPVPAHGFSGRIALTRFVTGTGNRFYEPYTLPLRDTTFAELEDNRITAFDGPDETPLIAHYQDIAGRYDLDPWFVHSWHAGIHPGCGFSADAGSQIMRWAGSAFGNPRVLHFHTCGAFAPGEISWLIIDPTITVDGVALWEKGALYPERLPDCARILSRHANLAALFRSPQRNIGL